MDITQKNTMERKQVNNKLSKNIIQPTINECKWYGKNRLVDIHC